MEFKRDNFNTYYSQANDYDNANLLPFRIYAEFPTFLNLIGDLTSKSVLDIACGTGVITRLLLNSQPKSVQAIDINDSMLSIAKKHLSTSSNVDFIHGDFCTYSFEYKFDLAVSAFGMNEMNCVEELNAFVEALSKCIEIGGKVCIEFDNAKECIHYQWDRFGVCNYQLLENRGNTLDYQLTLKVNDTNITLRCTYFSEQILQQIFSDNGFSNIVFHDLRLPESAILAMGKDYWNQFDQCSLTRFLVATKK
ncbi:MAG: class I SAM-dependent methyltransferase [Parashewanella sp.]